MYVNNYHYNSDMGWPTKGTGKNYNSNTGFGFFIGAYSKKVLFHKMIEEIGHVC